MCRGCLRPDAHAGDRRLRGLVNNMPAYALIFMLFTMANAFLARQGLSETLTLVGIFQVNTWPLWWRHQVILSAAYALWLYRRVVMGDLIKESLRAMTDLT